jgi:hypothetical protein
MAVPGNPRAVGAIRAALIAPIIALALVAGAATPTRAQVPVRHPIKVSTCQPSRNVIHTGGGWGPGYYPVGPYRWPSVYGYNYYEPPLRTSDPTLAIDYTNDTSQVMKQIEFGLVANGNLVAEVKDVGTFSPGVEIKHEFGLSRNVFPIRTALSRCVPLTIVYADGTKWKNPHLPALKRRLGL